jgi:Cu2+-exporting ATPase
MLLSGVVIAGGTLVAGTFGASVRSYREKKRKKESAWTVYAERMAKNDLVIYRRKSPFLVGKKRFPTKVAEGKAALIKFKEEQITPLFSGQQENEISKEEKEINRYLTYGGISLALATGGLWSPVLNILYVPAFLYTLRPFLVRAYQGVVKEKKVGVAVMDALGTAGPFLLGHFFVASLAICLANLSHKLIIKTEDHSRGSLINIFGEQPRFVWIEKACPDGGRKRVEVEIPFETLSVGDIVVVQAGQTICVDGIISKGVASIDERALTGESQPVEKSVGEPVFASTILLSGRIYIQVEKAGASTVAAQIGDILNSSADFKSSVLSRGQKIVELGATPTIALSTLALPFLGLEPALALLYASFGYHMRFAAPISVLNFLRITSENGILIKDGRSLELLSEVDTFVFDKTGTLTQNEPHVGTIYTCDARDENQLLTYAAAAEHKQTHPIGLAIQKEATERKLNVPPIGEAKVELGYGLKVRMLASQGEGQLIRVGSGRFMVMESITIPDEYQQIEEAAHENGHSLRRKRAVRLVYVAIDEQLGGAIELVPTIRPEAKQIINELHERNMKVVIISGDHEAPTQKLAQSLGIEHYFAQVLPQDKASLIEQLQQEGQSVCFIGDGINDSIALKTANVSISMSGASTIATDTAAIILMDGSLNQFIRLLDIANELDTNLTRSTIITIIPGVICVGGVFFLHFGIVSSVMLFNMGLVASVSNGLLPLIRHQRDKRVSAFTTPPPNTEKQALYGSLRRLGGERRGARVHIPTK